MTTGRKTTAEPVVVRSYFARWRRWDTGRWSRIHWFREGQPVCGVQEPSVECDFDLPPEPILTCIGCARANEAMQVAERTP